jgi:hypothetical protein
VNKLLHLHPVGEKTPFTDNIIDTVEEVIDALKTEVAHPEGVAVREDEGDGNPPPPLLKDSSSLSGKQPLGALFKFPRNGKCLPSLQVVIGYPEREYNNKGWLIQTSVFIDLKKRNGVCGGRVEGCVGSTSHFPLVVGSDCRLHGVINTGLIFITPTPQGRTFTKL